MEVTRARSHKSAVGTTVVVEDEQDHAGTSAMQRVAESQSAMSETTTVGNMRPSAIEG